MKTELNIYQKLLAAKKEIGVITKDSKNPFFKSNYLSLNGLIEAVEPILLKNGLVLLQPIKDNIVTTIIFDADNGESVSSEMTLIENANPQQMGSQISYFRRYTLQSLLAVESIDDDAQSAPKTATTKTTDHSKNELPWLNVDMKEYKGALAKQTPIATLRKYFRISKSNAAVYEAALKLNA